ncbi:hypothetical protein AAVH_09872 [Aphelenchoides avenae]|nr:hypothetical protein AAVH_09872 [Aphelenchus avenae]
MATIRFPRVINRSAQDTIAKFNKKEEESQEQWRRNPFNKNWTPPTYDKTAVDYARPEPGSKTEARARKAGQEVMNEIVFLCEIIRAHAEGEPPNCVIKFGTLFVIYNYYSQHLVGMLIRARKYGLVEFEGEMLYQRQDDHKPVRLLKTLDEVRQVMQYSGDPVNLVKTC